MDTEGFSEEVTSEPSRSTERENRPGEALEVGGPGRGKYEYRPPRWGPAQCAQGAERRLPQRRLARPSTGHPGPRKPGSFTHGARCPSPSLGASFSLLVGNYCLCPSLGGMLRFGAHLPATNWLTEGAASEAQTHSWQSWGTCDGGVLGSQGNQGLPEAVDWLPKRG